jgi:hypothetical protein
MHIKDINADCIHLAQDRVQWWTPCEHNNEPSGFIKDRKYLDQMSDHQLLKKASAPRS